MAKFNAFKPLTMPSIVDLPASCRYKQELIQAVFVHLFICLSVFLLSISFSSVSLSLVASMMAFSPFLAACHFGKINACVLRQSNSCSHNTVL